MAGIDIFELFPNSRMAAAAKSGLSQFRSVEGLDIPATYNSAATPANVATGTRVALIGGAVSGSESGIVTLNTPGVLDTAALLALAGLTSEFSSLSFNVNTAPAGVLIAQGAGFAIYPQGEAVSFNNVSVANNPVTLTLVAGDTVFMMYSGA